MLPSRAMSTATGKHADSAKEFHLKEYEYLRREIEWLMTYYRSLERNVVVAVGVTWGWLFSNRQQLPRWTWFIPCLFSFLGTLRSITLVRDHDHLHEYLYRVEKAFSSANDPGGWEHFREAAVWKSRSVSVFWRAFNWGKRMTKSPSLFWILLTLSTVAVGVYECLSRSR